MLEEGRIRFEISDRCSEALWEIIRARGWQDQKSFTLPIKKGSVLSLLSKLSPNWIGLFHVGCVSDSRPPNFSYEITVGDYRNGLWSLGYCRRLRFEVFVKNNWFHDGNDMRDLEKVVIAMSDAQNYEEDVGLVWSGPYKGLGRAGSVILLFENDHLKTIEGLAALQKEEEPLRAHLKGFKGSLLDLEKGPLSYEKEALEKWRIPAEVIQRKVDAEDIIKELYRLFLLSTAGA